MRGLAGLALAGLIMAGLIFGWGYQAYRSPGPRPESITIVIPKGATTLQIARQLQAGGLIKSSYAFAVAAHLVRARLKAGEYEFAPHATGAAIIAELASGRVVVHHLTVPEGLTNQQVAALVAGDPTLNGEMPSLPAEGELLPETYNFVLGDNRAAMVGRMQAAAKKTLGEAWARRDPAGILATPAQALVLASIVEKETGLPEERPQVAAVFLNRLRLGMKLQSDPTVIYALDDGSGPLGRTLSHADLATESPYNTYEKTGLPPGPICNPGRSAIEAVLHPASSEALYFVATGNGGHAFAATLEEHNRNVAAWLKTLHDRAP